jgi:hypothetical protein
MNWLNIQLRLVHTPEYIGSDPVHRGNWLSLLAYCAEQENGGRIPNCRAWKSRMWEQLCGVTAEEVLSESNLWEWDGNDLVVWEYPFEKQEEVQRNRESGRRGGMATTEAKKRTAIENGIKGGRPKTQAEPKDCLGYVTQAEPKRNPSENPTERKGIGIGKEGEAENARAQDQTSSTDDIPTNQPPEAIIPTLSDIEAEASMRGITPASALSFFNHHQNQNLWLNKWGRAINWRSKLATWAAEDRSRPKTNGNGHASFNGNGSLSLTIKPPSVFELKTRRDAILEEMVRLEERGTRDAFGVSLKPEDKARMKALKAERAKIQEQLIGLPA